MSHMVRLGMVVEGRSDCEFLEKKRPWFNQQGFALTIHQARDRSRLIRKARRRLEILQQKGCQKVFFFIDQDRDECPPATAKLLTDVAREKDAIVCVVARELEAWFLADQEAVTKATGQRFKRRPTDRIPDPKETLKNLFYKKRKKFLTEPEMVRALCPHFSFERAAEGNGSARRFLKKLRAC